MSVELAPTDYIALRETDLVGLARAGDGGAIQAIIQSCNQRLYRIARGVLADDAEAEDVLQETWLRAFARLSSFRGESSLATWLGAITLNEARGRLRRRRRGPRIATLDGDLVASAPESDPEAEAARSQSRRLIERALDELPVDFRLVFMLRVVEGCSVAETAASLGIRPQTVRTRLHRARALLRRGLDRSLGEALTGAFPFLGARCARIAAAVLERLNPV